MGYVFLAACAAVALWIAHGAYKILVYPKLSPYRHLPSPDQGPIWKRLFTEPDTFDFLRWADQVPNDGLIRYFGILNDERLQVTSTQGLVQLLQKDTYLYRKASAQGQLVRFLAGDNVVVAEGNKHKVGHIALALALAQPILLTIPDCPQRTATRLQSRSQAALVPALLQYCPRPGSCHRPPEHVSVSFRHRPTRHQPQPHAQPDGPRHDWERLRRHRF